VVTSTLSILGERKVGREISCSFRHEKRTEDKILKSRDSQTWGFERRCNIHRPLMGIDNGRLGRRNPHSTQTILNGRGANRIRGEPSTKKLIRKRGMNFVEHMN